jgi:hypothetical protein
MLKHIIILIKSDELRNLSIQNSYTYNFNTFLRKVLIGQQQHRVWQREINWRTAAAARASS